MLLSIGFAFKAVNLRFFAFALVLGMIVSVILKLPVLFWIFAGFHFFIILRMRGRAGCYTHLMIPTTREV